jgi:REP-associated tyrosine transposase
MPRTARASEAGFTYHVLNRGNARAQVFHKPADYAAFLQIIGEASLRLPMAMLAYCLMPNHFHLVVRPVGDGDLSRWMQWLLTTHVRRYLKHYGHSGHVWQGRFKAFAIQDDDHLITVVRYVERNPLRAGLVSRAEDWLWSSLGATRSATGAAPCLTGHGLLRNGDWMEFVNSPMTEAEAEAIRVCIRRNRPFGSDAWTQVTAVRLGLESSIRDRGSQRQEPKNVAQNH